MRKKAIILGLLVVFGLCVVGLVACQDDANKEPKQVTLTEGTFHVGDFDTGVTLQDCVQAEYKQEGETLKGSLSMKVLFYDYFDEVTYSVTRTGATIGEETFVDTAIEETELKSKELMIPLEVAYHGNWELNVNLTKGGESLADIYIPVNVTASHYNIYYLNATLPVLLASSQLFTEQGSGVTYMGLDRRATYNWYELPENVYGFPNTVVSDATTNLGLFDENGKEKTTVYGNQDWGSWGVIAQSSDQNNVKHVQKWIADLYAIDKRATFTFGCVDNSVLSSLIFGYGNNIPAKNFDIEIFTDGTSTTNALATYEMTTYTKWVQTRDEYENYIQGIANNLPASIFGHKDFPFVMCADENVRYIVNCKPAILAAVSADAQLTALYGENIEQLSVGDAFARVEEMGKTEKLERLLRTRWTDNTGAEGTAAEYFQYENGKKSLMILGTSEGGETGNGVGAEFGSGFLDIMEFVVEEYGDEYNILYKGHPAWPLSRFIDGDTRKKFFNENGITILPNATPAETFMYLYENVYVGGYYSTTFTSSQVGQTICFFGSEEAIKAQPSTAPMFDENSPDYLGVFENSVFIDTDFMNQNIA